MNYKKNFLKRAEEAIGQEFLQIALDRNAQRRKGAINKAFASIPDVDGLKEKAGKIRAGIIEELPEKSALFEENLKQNGFIVHRAETAEEAARIVKQICKENGAGLAAKSKSMVTEEIHLNEVLEAAGIEVVETDLGEYIVQLRNEKPTHIITPAVHLRREDVADTFVEKLGMEHSLDVSKMNDAARKALREVFLNADVGISGVNFGVIENGALCLLTNEGNGRMVTTVPPVHIAVMGLERMVNTYDELAVMLKLLPRSATGQKITSYVNVIQGPKREGDLDGPEERHVILVDNGRLAVQQSDFAEILKCIRCGACINVCPVYQELGGAVYGSTYPGPIGSVLSPALFGTEEFGHLAKASTLCGACGEICPVRIDLPELLLKTRQAYVSDVQQPLLYRVGMKAYAFIMKSAQRYELINKLAASFLGLLPGTEKWIEHIPFGLMNWTTSRQFPRFATKSFHTRMINGEITQKVNETPVKKEQIIEPITTRKSLERSISDSFIQEVEVLGGEVNQSNSESLPLDIASKLIDENIQKIVLSQELMDAYPELDVILHKTGVEFILADENNGVEELADGISAGLNFAHSGIADTGSLVFPSGDDQSQLVSLLPETHITVLDKARLFGSMEDWLDSGKIREVERVSNFCLISGPSRTADIEMTLTIGVHGPGKLIVFLI